MTTLQSIAPRPPRKQSGYFWFFAFALAGVLAMTGISHWLTPRELIPWRDDFTAAGTESRETGKPMFVYFTADWCGPCQGMKRTTFADSAVEAALRSYVPTRIDIDRNAALAQQYGVQSIPYFVVMNADGTVRKELSVGAVDSETFLDWLN